MNILKQIIKEEILKEFKMQDQVVAYHCGSKKPESDFVVGSHLFSGEGYMILGPGIYFAGAFSENAEEIDQARATAERYCKYSAESYLYQVDIDVSSVYDGIGGNPTWLKDKIVEVGKSIPEQYKRGISVTKYGNGTLGEINAWQHAIGNGTQGTLEIYRQIGVKGAVTWLPIQPEFDRRVWEIAVYDPSIISNIFEIERYNFRGTDDA